ncbi:MAG: Holliday junction resolvase RuvX [Patescibacteria group bacterium]|nr:Holliday junction resolvase RuvX [Patescibacteria group bacterium]MDE2218632.1 Holliday junction resolvase RuvX [Patescibacteria group bacterium]
MRLIGIDFGKKRVGITMSDEEGKIAFPKTVYSNDNKLVDKIANDCKENSVGGIVLGESKNFKGKDNPIMKDILKFKEKIERATSLPVFMEPEFMSSSEAKKMRSEDDGKEMLDASAAAVILQSHLDKKAMLNNLP